MTLGRPLPGRAAAQVAVAALLWAIASCASPPPREADGGAATGAAAPDAAAAAAPSWGDAAAPPGWGEPPDADGPSDDIYGRAVARSRSFWTEDGRIYRGDEQLRLFGLNWFGLETTTLALHGPSQANRSVAEFLEQLGELGFNALRVPVSPQAVRPGFRSAPAASYGAVETGLAHLEELLTLARAAGIYVLLDLHTCAVSAGYLVGAPDDPACGGYSEDDWIGDLERMAELAGRYAPFVVGIDLFNEPHALDWTRWRELTERGGEAVLRFNPRVLLFVQGIGGEGYSGSHGPFWGENLSRAVSEPIDLPPSRLVYAPHVYGPSVYAQPYFAAESFPDNMPAIWDEHFGFLEQSGATVVPGEFGGRYVDADRVWQDAFVDYLLERDMRSFFYWSLNPNSGDTGGLLQSDWQSVDEGKLELLERLMK